MAGVTDDTPTVPNRSRTNSNGVRLRCASASTGVALACLIAAVAMPALAEDYLSAVQQPLAQVLIDGNVTIPASEIQKHVSSRPGRPVDPVLVREDVRKLHDTRWFASVSQRVKPTDEGPVLIFTVVEKPILRKVGFKGNRKIKTRYLAALTGLQPDHAYDVLVNREAARRIEEYYRDEGFAFAKVTLEKGDSVRDREVIFKIEEGPKVRVVSVQFRGNTIASDGRLSTYLMTDKAGFDFLPFSNRLPFGGLYDPTTIPNDIAVLTKYYHDLGFFDVSISDQVNFSPDRAKVTIVYSINEGLRYRVRRIEYDGNRVLPTKELVRDRNLNEGEYFDRRGLDRDLNEIRESYGNLGRLYASVEAIPRFSETPGVADLIVRIDEDKPYIIRNIYVDIAGTHPHTKTNVIRNHFTVAPGSIANPREIRRSKSRIEGVPAFAATTGGAVKVDIQRVSSETQAGFRGQSPDTRGGVDVYIHDGEARRYRQDNPYLSRPAAEPQWSEPFDSAPEAQTNSRRPAISTARNNPFASSATREERPRPLDSFAAADDSTTGGPNDLELRPDNPFVGPPHQPMSIPYRESSPSWPATTSGATRQRSNFGATYDESHPFAAMETKPARPSSNDFATADFAPSINRVERGTPVMPVATTKPSTSNLNAFDARNDFAATDFEANTAAPSGIPTASTRNPFADAPLTASTTSAAPAVVSVPRQSAPSPTEPTVNTADATYTVSENPYSTVQQTGVGPFQERNPLFPPSPMGDPFRGALEEPGLVDLRVSAREAQTGRLMFGAAVNSNAGLVGNVVLEEQNFDLFRFPTSFSDITNGTAFRGGGQRFRLEAVPGTQVSRYTVSWQDPFIFDTNYSFGASGFYFQRFYEDWNEQRAGGRFNIGRQFSPFVSAGLISRVEEVELSDPSVPTPASLQEALGDNFLFTLGGVVRIDTRDNALNPTEGTSVELNYTQGISEYTYSQADIEAYQYYTLFSRPDGSGKQILSLRGQLGYSTDDTPIFERFFAGGFQTFRGFDFRGVGPREQGVSVGGDFLAIGTVQYQVPLLANDALAGVVFSDFGTLEPDVQIEDFRVSVGAGLRIQIPALGPVPLAFDFAYPIVKAPFDDQEIFSFYIGVQR
ncbi:BamA/TamA family outer membrane protein [Stratiformator vulcanicus]|uniref:Outer membrane protein assembly factor BamA n=1 Tax=Stratiformator vulcanicus TaxID=2527980 RepID=A0A517R2L4_9PLAN|nr:BamA/TamA family outer membrane protein [Stratiformator vulcanicus]QDT38117.1 Outer membrane protein assembly factor BamA precursor [Stratiformator vulcanicus]